MSTAQLVDEWKKKGDPFLVDTEGFQKFIDERMPKVLKEEEKEGERKWNLLFSAFERPVVYDSMGRAWVDTLPAWIRGEILTERLIQAMKGEEGKATDAEVVAHLYTACMTRALDYYWTKIYCYLVCQLMRRAKRVSNIDEIEKELKVRPLDDYEQQLLNRLKRNIWDSGMRASKQKRRERKRMLRNLRSEANLFEKLERLKCSRNVT